MLRFPLLLIALLFVTACAAPPAKQYPPLRFTNKTPIHLDVANIEVRNEYQAPQKAPNIEHVFPVTPAEAMSAWTNDRIKAVGAANRLLVTIKEASVVESKLPTTQGFKGLFTNDQAGKLEANLVVDVRLYGSRNVSLASTEVRANRHATVPENISLSGRDDLHYSMTRALMNDLNAELEKNMHQYFSQYIHYSYQP